MNRLCVVALLILSGFAVRGQVSQYTGNSGQFDGQGYFLTYGNAGTNGTISFSADWSSFTMGPIVQSSLQGNARVGFYTYYDDAEVRTISETYFTKKDSSFELGSFGTGQNLGFFLETNKGVVTDFYFKEEGDRLALVFNSNGDTGNSSRDDTIIFGDFPSGVIDTGGAPSGSPLPDAVTTLLISGAMLGAGRLLRRRRTAGA